MHEDQFSHDPDLNSARHEPFEPPQHVQLPVVATWRGEPERPPHLLRAYSDTMRQVPLSWRIAALAYASYAIATALLPHSVGRNILVILFSGVIYLAIFQRIRDVRDWSDRRQGEDLLDQGSPVPQYLARLSLATEGIVFGEEVGVASFVEEMLVFSGPRTHFSVSSEFLVRTCTPESKGLVPHDLLMHYEVEDNEYFAYIKWLPKYDDVSTVVRAGSERRRQLGRGRSKLLVVSSTLNQWYESLNELVKMLGPGATAIRLDRARNSQDEEIELEWKQSTPSEGALCVLPPITPSPNAYRVVLRAKMTALSLTVAFATILLLEVWGFKGPISRPNHHHTFLLAPIAAAVFVVLITVTFLYAAIHSYRQARRLQSKLELMRSAVGMPTPSPVGNEGAHA